MDKEAKKFITKCLHEAADAIEANTSEIETETALAIADLLTHRALSKEQACLYLGNMSRSKFNQYVALGKLPKGRKVQGYNELRWYADELNKYKTKI